MPEYDVTNYPKSLAPNLSGGEVGRQPTDLPATWPAARHLPEQYDGPVPAREWETNAARVITAQPVPPVPPPTDSGPVLPSIAPPPA